jgi:hypothetical protein
MTEFPSVIYLDGKLADLMGSVSLTEFATVAATLTGRRVDVLTLGKSEHHSKSRYHGTPRGFARDMLVSFGPRSDDQIEEYGE